MIMPVTSIMPIELRAPAPGPVAKTSGKDARGAGELGLRFAKTTVVVRGRPNPLQAAGRDTGVKLMEIKRLREKGHRITFLSETQFWRLVGRRVRTL
jgi:hypothetical protein